MQGSFQWSVPSVAAASGKHRGGTPTKPARSSGGTPPIRKYSARLPTANEFSRTWTNIGHISPHDKISCLERCDNKYGYHALLCYSHDENALDAFVFVATGWQPGHELFERDRDKFQAYFASIHADRGYPLRELSPEQALHRNKEALGLVPDLAFILDQDSWGQAYISNGMHSTLLPKPADGRTWTLCAPSPGEGPQRTLVTDGVSCYLAVDFFTAQGTPVAAATAAAALAPTTQPASSLGCSSLGPNHPAPSAPIIGLASSHGQAYSFNYLTRQKPPPKRWPPASLSPPAPLQASTPPPTRKPF